MFRRDQLRSRLSVRPSGKPPNYRTCLPPWSIPRRTPSKVRALHTRVMRCPSTVIRVDVPRSSKITTLRMYFGQSVKRMSCNSACFIREGLDVLILSIGVPLHSGQPPHRAGTIRSALTIMTRAPVGDPWFSRNCSSQLVRTIHHFGGIGVAFQTNSRGALNTRDTTCGSIVFN